MVSYPGLHALIDTDAHLKRGIAGLFSCGCAESLTKSTGDALGEKQAGRRDRHTRLIQLYIRSIAEKSPNRLVSDLLFNSFDDPFRQC